MYVRNKVAISAPIGPLGPLFLPHRVSSKLLESLDHSMLTTVPMIKVPTPVPVIAGGPVNELEKEATVVPLVELKLFGMGRTVVA